MDLELRGRVAVVTGASAGIGREIARTLAAEGAQVYAEFATLNGRQYVDAHPEAWPVNDQGERAPAATWFMGACPTEPGFLEHRLTQLRTLVGTHAVAGVWLDYLHWHAQFEEPVPVLPETCFNEPCLAAFQTATGIRIPDGPTAERARWILTHRERAWREWRCGVLVDWVRRCRRVVQEARPGALLGIFHCPWSNEDFGGAGRRILGLDLRALGAEADVLSPMVYHGRMGRPPAWVGDAVRWLGAAVRAGTSGAPRIWPIVQARGDSSQAVSPAEFETVLRSAITGGADGVMMFTLQGVAEDAEKTAVLRRVYGEWQAQRP